MVNNEDRPTFDPINRPSVEWTDEAEKTVLAGLASGETLWTFLARHQNLPNYQQVIDRRRRHPEFAEKYDAAREAGQEARLEEALDNQFAVRGSKELSIAAQKYSDVAVKMAEKLAPKRFGAMLRHAGADGERLTVQVVSFAEGGALEAVATPVNAAISSALTPKQGARNPDSTGE